MKALQWQLSSSAMNAADSVLACPVWRVNARGIAFLRLVTFCELLRMPPKCVSQRLEHVRTVVERSEDLG